jgi:hypothetical protein
MNKLSTTVAVLAGAGFGVPAVAHADDPADIYSYAWHDSRMSSGIGVSTILGGGVTGFTDKTMRDSVTSDVGGLWGLHVLLGSHTPLGVDVSYVGTAANINSLIGTQRGTLIGTTAEAALRYNILPHFAWNPYAFAGVGWQRYDVTGGTFNLSDTGMNASDNSVVFPMGLGMAYRDPTGLVVDLHGTFRANTNQGLVLQSAGSTSYAPMHTWEASAAIGYEF